jgi:5-keto 4-deoxyuronate isomerase
MWGIKLVLPHACLKPTSSVLQHEEHQDSAKLSNDGTIEDEYRRQLYRHNHLEVFATPQKLIGMTMLWDGS